jgi:RNA polymerase sigma factor (sigma-70 family)
MEHQEIDENFARFLAALRNGDEQAVEELVRLCEPQLRRIARARLAEGDLRREADSMDIVQSVLTSFIRRAAAGEFAFETPDQLLRLLRTMALNRLRDLARKGGAQGRTRPMPGHGVAGASTRQVAAEGPTPSEHVAQEDFLEQFLLGLSPEARQIHRWRASGWSWAEVGAELNAEPSTIRIRFARETLRVARELGL